MIFSGAAKRRENSSAIALGISASEFENPGRADTAMLVRSKSCRQLCQVSRRRSWSAPIRKMSETSGPTSWRIERKVSMVYVAPGRSISWESMVKESPSGLNAYSSMAMRCFGFAFNRGFCQGFPAGMRRNSLVLNKRQKYFPSSTCPTCTGSKLPPKRMIHRFVKSTPFRLRLSCRSVQSGKTQV